MCGFVHSIFVSTPVSVIGWSTSYSAPNEWCAAVGAASDADGEQQAKSRLAGHGFPLSTSEASIARSRSGSGRADAPIYSNASGVAAARARGLECPTSFPGAFQ